MRKADTHLKVVLVDFFILSNNNSAHPKWTAENAPKKLTAGATNSQGANDCHQLQLGLRPVHLTGTGRVDSSTTPVPGRRRVYGSIGPR
jgi:hypothetical protein